MKLIPNDVDINEQFRRRAQFVNMAKRWNFTVNNVPITNDESRIDLNKLQQASGVQCYRVGRNLTGFELVDEKIYTMWMLRWS
jgi:hypothetical protein